MNFSQGIGNAFEPFNAVSLDSDNRFKADVGDYRARIYIDCILTERQDVELVLHQFSEAMYQLLETVKKSEVEK